MANKIFIYIGLVLKAIKALTILLVANLLTRRPDKDIWLISERGKDARDNGFWLFIYMKTNHPEIDSYYVITKDSADYNRLSKYSDSLIELNSFAHFKALSKAKYLISTHIGGCLPMSDAMIRISNTFNILRHKKIIFLQHGITKDYIPRLFGNFVKLDLFCCGAKLEYDYVSSVFRFPEGVVKYTGFCRYDNLIDFNSKRQILIMPTWRTYVDLNRFEESDYFKTYADLLTNVDFEKIIDTNNYNVVFYLHYQFQSKRDSFKKLDLHPSITIAGFEYDVQTLLKESDFLITDYSSVYFDMVYMNKPVIFYQFDKEKFHSEHYQKGYVEENRIGRVVDKLNDLLDATKQTITSNCILESQYQEYINEFFPIRDKNNCKRVYQAITQI